MRKLGICICFIPANSNALELICSIFSTRAITKPFYFINVIASSALKLHSLVADQDSMIVIAEITQHKI